MAAHHTNNSVTPDSNGTASNFANIMFIGNT